MKNPSFNDLTDEQKKWGEYFKNPDFSWKKLKESCIDAESEGRLQEGTASTMFGQLLRAGIQTFAINAYQVVPVVYPDVVQEVPSGRRQEFYAPLYRPDLPRPVAASSRFEDSKVKGQDVELVNFKFGRIEAFERELFDDDQTGQVKQRAGLMGENFKIFEEIYVMGKITGLGNASFSVPASAYVDKAGTGASGPFQVAIGNRPTSYTILGQTPLEDAFISLDNMKDPLGNKFLVLPSVLLVGTKERFNSAKLMNSALQPSVPSTATFGTGATQTAQFQAGATGWTMTQNPLQGLAQIRISRFLPDRAWMLLDPKKGFVFQRRDPLEVIQEQPQSGDSFNVDVFRFRTRARWEVDYIEPRFHFLGNDGSVTS